MSVTIRADQPGAVINPNIYGQFAEHLGAGIYEGIWVGEKSAIPNTNGYRNDVIDALKNLHVPVVRWPGGCFADEYHWRDGIGPRAKRPVKVNTHWGGVTETNDFGTHEFMTFAELIGAKVYISGNVGSGSPQEMADWMEYMTSNTVSTLANERRKNGRDKPWEVQFLRHRQRDLGLRRQHDAGVLRRICSASTPPTSKRRAATGRRSSPAAATTSTPCGSTCSRRTCSATWMRISHHYYTTPTGVWAKKGNALGFPGIRMDLDAGEHACGSTSTSASNAKIMDKYDPQKQRGVLCRRVGHLVRPGAGQRSGLSLPAEHAARCAGRRRSTSTSSTATPTGCR